MKKQRKQYTNIDFLSSVEDKVSPALKSNVDFNLQVLERINFLLQTNLNGKKRDLAEKMGKAESQISKYFSGYQNFTLQTIFELEQALGGRILGVCRDGEDEGLTETGDFMLIDGQKRVPAYIPSKFTQETKVSIDNLIFEEV